MVEVLVVLPDTCTWQLVSVRNENLPAEATGTGIRFRSTERIFVVVNWPSESGPAYITQLVSNPEDGNTVGVLLLRTCQ